MFRYNNERRKNDSLRQEIRDIFKGLRDLFDALEKEIEKKEIEKKEIEKKEIEKKECEKKEEKEMSEKKMMSFYAEEERKTERGGNEREEITSEVISNLATHVPNHAEHALSKLDNEFSIACPMETKFKECFEKDDIVEKVDFIFPFPLDIQIKHALDLRTNPFQEEENDTSLARATGDPNKVPAEFVERTRAMEFEDGNNGLVQRFWAQTNSWRPIELNYSKWGLSKVFGLRNNECSCSDYRRKLGPLNDVRNNDGEQ